MPARVCPACRSRCCCHLNPISGGQEFLARVPAQAQIHHHRTTRRSDRCISISVAQLESYYSNLHMLQLLLYVDEMRITNILDPRC
jgi:hypothetical protein